jgi:hypothetical protein
MCMHTSFPLNVAVETTLNTKCASVVVDYASPSLPANSRCMVRELAAAKGDADSCAIKLKIDCVPMTMPRDSRCQTCAHTLTYTTQTTRIQPTLQHSRCHCQAVASVSWYSKTVGRALCAHRCSRRAYRPGLSAINCLCHVIRGSSRVWLPM